MSDAEKRLGAFVRGEPISQERIDEIRHGVCRAERDALQGEISRLELQLANTIADARQLIEILVKADEVTIEDGRKVVELANRYRVDIMRPIMREHAARPSTPKA